ncbi:plexin-B-like isoform X2 [Dysidea avara]|uniref:plexin-B-like isoform X2 n=1 Tax=Dysidea avara TaxID=196820 RepID=UPI0033185499
MCIGNFAISPNTLPVELTSYQFHITTDLIPPPLADESYYCVFGHLGSSVVEGNLIPGMDFTDLTCNYSFTVDQFSDGIFDTIVVDFSLRSDIGNINFITITDGFSFFNCSAHTKCSSCLSSDNLCGWCLYDKKCTSSNDQCEGLPEWISTGRDTITACPVILSPHHGIASDYQQPVGTSRFLPLDVMNMPAPHEEYRYQCVISYNGLQSILRAEHVGPDVIHCITRPNSFSQVEYIRGRIDVRWTRPDLVYELENEVDPLNVILYNCSALAGGCSSCLSVSNTLMLDCGWCNRSCVIMESCSDGSIFTTTSSTCPLPNITMVNPNSGPYQGGTDVTISGTDLGVVVDDILIVTIGGAQCVIQADSYQPGIGVTCTTTRNSTTNSEVNITMKINRDEGPGHAVLLNGFRYAEVTISGFYPTKIPRSGDIVINVTGNNFNISDPSLARIDIVEIPCIVIVRTLNSTFVQCVAGPRPMSGSGKVVFRIDNGEALSDDDFEYSDDPEVSFLVTRSIIKSGGIDLIFLGTDLNLVQIDMVIDIVNITNDMLVMRYNTNCLSSTEDSTILYCSFPIISSDLISGVENGVLILHYSLVAASVPGLTNLHMRPSLQLEIVDDPEFNRFSSIVTYQPGSNKTLMISGSRIDVVRQEEVTIIIDNSTCNIISVTATTITCIPPEFDIGVVTDVVHMVPIKCTVNQDWITCMSLLMKYLNKRTLI